MDGDDDHSAVFLDAGRCADSDAPNGSGRQACDWRTETSISNVMMTVYDDGTATGTQAHVCLGDTATLIDDPSDAGMQFLGDARGELPQLLNIRIADASGSFRRSADVEHATMLAADRSRVHRHRGSPGRRSPPRPGRVDPRRHYGSRHVRPDRGRVERWWGLPEQVHLRQGSGYLVTGDLDAAVTA